MAYISNRSASWAKRPLRGKVRGDRLQHPVLGFLRKIPRNLTLEHNNKQAVFEFSQRDMPWPAAIRRKSSEMRCGRSKEAVLKYLVISSKILPNSSTVYNFYVTFSPLFASCYVSLLRCVMVHQKTTVSDYPNSAVTWNCWREWLLC